MIFAYVKLHHSPRLIQWHMAVTNFDRKETSTESPYVTLMLSSASIHRFRNNIPPRGMYYRERDTLATNTPLRDNIVISSTIDLNRSRTYLSDGVIAPLPAKSRTQVRGFFHGHEIAIDKMLLPSPDFDSDSRLVTTRDIPISVTPGRRGVPLFRVSTLWCVLLFYQ